MNEAALGYFISHMFAVLVSHSHDKSHSFHFCPRRKVHNLEISAHLDPSVCYWCKICVPFKFDARDGIGWIGLLEVRCILCLMFPSPLDFPLNFFSLACFRKCRQQNKQKTTLWMAIIIFCIWWNLVFHSITTNVDTQQWE